MKPVVWGVLSSARIGVQKVIPGMLRSPLVEVRGIASRSLDAAQSAAQTLGIPRAFGSYEELIADPAIEAIYNPLPNHLHVPLTLAAARAGKHVLCEKPIALDAAEAAQLREVAGRVRIAEAFMVRHHPQWQRLRELLRAGRIGVPRVVQVAFSFFNDNPADIRNQRETGGGALYDIGCYAIAAGRYVFESEPLRVMAMMDRDPALAVDRATSGLLDFGASRQLAFTVTTQCASQQRLVVLGTRGRIELEIPFNPPQGGTTRIRIDDGSALDGSSALIEALPEADQYQRLVENFSRTVRGEPAPFWDLEDAICQMQVIDALWRSESSGAWEKVATEASPGAGR
ncbi:MAG TPA: Gfo/Idh/MocA family oxidoreductase [Steroidobacteraceae bacterium]|nr:Gfo/Idh/MocA family oxidoreductase [Steroidobacteraceae bacterium]